MTDKQFGLYIMIISVLIGIINLLFIKTETILVYAPYPMVLLGAYYHIKHIFI